MRSQVRGGVVLTAEEGKRVRTGLGVNQNLLGRLVGVHAQTVSKWERGVSPVPPYQAALLRCFGFAIEKEPGVGTRANVTFHFAGVAQALLVLLLAAHGCDTKPEL